MHALHQDELLSPSRLRDALKSGKERQQHAADLAEIWVLTEFVAGERDIAEGFAVFYVHAARSALDTTLCFLECQFRGVVKSVVTADRAFTNAKGDGSVLSFSKGYIKAKTVCFFESNSILARAKAAITVALRRSLRDASQWLLRRSGGVRQI